MMGVAMQIMDSELRIVLARPIDFEDYIGLLEEIADWLDARGVGQVRPGTYRQFAEYYAASIAAEEVHLGLFNNKLAGSFRLVQDGGPVWPGVDNDSLYLENLVVRRAWSGRSVGRQLLHWAEQKALLAGKNYIRLDCFAINPVLRKYYQDAGYEDCGEIEAQYVFGSLRLRRFQKRLQVSV
jgi:GNAT superfamily N-acetyltransferase